MKIDFIIPSFKSFDLTDICVRSFEKFKPSWAENRYIVIENSKDDSYKDSITSISDGVVWFNNPTSLRGSDANADAIKKGMEFVESDYIFFCHCDTCVTSPNFYTDFRAKMETNSLVGTVLDSIRIKALHISGVMAKRSDIPCKDLNYFPTYDAEGRQNKDVGDILTEYCRQKNLSYFCFENSFNDGNLKIPPPYSDYRIDRCIYGGEVIYLHLGRGIPKTRRTYTKDGRVYIDQWINLCRGILGED